MSIIDNLADNHNRNQHRDNDDDHGNDKDNDKESEMFGFAALRILRNTTTSPTKLETLELCAMSSSSGFPGKRRATDSGDVLKSNLSHWYVTDAECRLAGHHDDGWQLLCSCALDLMQWFDEIWRYFGWFISSVRNGHKWALVLRMRWRPSFGV